MSNVVLERSAVHTEAVLGDGAFGRVWRAKLGDSPVNYAYKEFKRDPGFPEIAHLQAMVARRAELTTTEQRRLRSLCAWPEQLVMADARLVGYLMPLAPARFFGA